MAVINGGEVVGMSTAQERDFIPKGRLRHLLVQHRIGKFRYLVDRFATVNSDLSELLRYVEDKVSKNWAKTIRGRIVGVLLIRFTDFALHPQRYGDGRGDLIFFANYFWVQQYLQRIAKLLIEVYGFPDRYYGFKVKKNKLYDMSKLWARDMLPIVESKMVPHYKRLQLR